MLSVFLLIFGLMFLFWLINAEWPVQAVTVVIFCVLFWLVDAELMDILSMLFVSVVAIFSFVNIFRKKTGAKLLLLLSFGFIVYALIARSIVVNDAKEFAASFVQTYQCAPAIKELTDSSGVWDDVSGDRSFRAVKTIRKMGYSRVMIYENRTLRYGYLDGGRVITLKQCVTAAP